MTRDDISRWAREAGFMDMDSLSAKVTDMFYHGFPRTERIHLCSDDRIERFAELVAAAEREECAALRGHPDVLAPLGNSAWGEAYQDGWIAGTAAYRDAICARGEKGQS